MILQSSGCRTTDGCCLTSNISQTHYIFQQMPPAPLLRNPLVTRFYHHRHIHVIDFGITAGGQDHLLSDVELSYLADKIICYWMSSYHSWLTRSYVIGCWSITAGRQDNFYRMLSYHSWQTKSYVIRCWATIAGWQDHLLSDIDLSKLADKIICYRMLSYHSWLTRSFV